jgi:hypothetical protein
MVTITVLSDVTQFSLVIWTIWTTWRFILEHKATSFLQLLLILYHGLFRFFDNLTMGSSFLFWVSLIRRRQ